MADIETRLKKFLQADTNGVAKVAGDRVNFDIVPPDKKRPYIWARKKLTNNFETLDSAAGEAAGEYQFDLECVSTNKPESQTLAEHVRARCHCYRGAFGDSTVLGMFVNDQDDDYVPLGIGENTGLYVVALGIQVFV